MAGIKNQKSLKGNEWLALDNDSSFNTVSVNKSGTNLREGRSQR